MIRLMYLLDYPIEKFIGNSNGSDAVKLLSSSIAKMVSRLCTIANDEVPEFKDCHETLEGFLKWKEAVKKCMEEHDV